MTYNAVALGLNTVMDGSLYVIDEPPCCSEKDREMQGYSAPSSNTPTKNRDTLRFCAHCGREWHTPASRRRATDRKRAGNISAAEPKMQGCTWEERLLLLREALQCVSLSNGGRNRDKNMERAQEIESGYGLSDG